MVPKGEAIMVGKARQQAEKAIAQVSLAYSKQEVNRKWLAEYKTGKSISSDILSPAKLHILEHP